MIKLISLIPRKPGLTREEFIDYYEKRHVPLSLETYPQIRRYVRNYAIGEKNGHYEGRVLQPGVPYDAVTEHWFDDRAALAEMARAFQDDPERMAAWSEDEGNFIDKSRIVQFLVEEYDTEI